MQFSKRGNIYVVTRVTGRQNNILGICFADEDYNSTGNNNNIEVIDGKFPKVTSTKIRTSKTELLNQVLSGLNFKNQAFGTNYKLSKIYYLPSESGSDRVYELLIAVLISHYHRGNEFKVR